MGSGVLVGGTGVAVGIDVTTESLTGLGEGFVLIISFLSRAVSVFTGEAEEGKMYCLSRRTPARTTKRTPRIRSVCISTGLIIARPCNTAVISRTIFDEDGGS